MNESPVCIAIDFETSGPARHMACAIGMARIEGKNIVDEYYSTIRPPSSRVWYTHIHGLRWADLKDSPTFPQLWGEIEAFIDGADYFIAHNARFDQGVLKGCCEYYGHPYPDLVFLDTLKGARRQFSLPANRLCDVCAHLDINLNHHHAASDALACGRIYLKLMEMGFPLQNLMIGKS